MHCKEGNTSRHSIRRVIPISRVRRVMPVSTINLRGYNARKEGKHGKEGNASILSMVRRVLPVTMHGKEGNAMPMRSVMLVRGVMPMRRVMLVWPTV